MEKHNDKFKKQTKTKSEGNFEFSQKQATLTSIDDSDSNSICAAHPTVELALNLENELEKYNTFVLNSFDNICTSLKDQNPALKNNILDFKNVIQNNHKSYNKVSKKFRDDFTNLVQLNHLLIQKLNNLALQLPSNNEKISIAVQTENLTSQSNEKSCNTDTVLTLTDTSDIASQTNFDFSQNNNNSMNLNLELPLSSISKNNALETQSQVPSKFIKIKIEEISADFDINEIILAIQNINNDPVSSITFLTKFELKYVNKCNFIFNIPELTALQLISDQNLIIKSMSFGIKPFIDIIRCFRCQQLSHCSNLCDNSITCAICGKSHSKKNCKGTPFCVNCFSNNKFNNTRFNVRHPTFSRNCSSVKLYIRQKRNAIKLLCQNL